MRAALHDHFDAPVEQTGEAVAGKLGLGKYASQLAAIQRSAHGFNRRALSTRSEHRHRTQLADFLYGGGN